jgi:hypothetical protein
LDGFHILVFAFEKTAHGRAKPAFALGHLIGFAQIFDDGLEHLLANFVR